MQEAALVLGSLADPRRVGEEETFRSECEVVIGESGSRESDAPSLSSNVSQEGCDDRSNRRVHRGGRKDGQQVGKAAVEVWVERSEVEEAEAQGEKERGRSVEGGAPRQCRTGFGRREEARSRPSPEAPRERQGRRDGRRAKHPWQRRAEEGPDLEARRWR